MISHGTIANNATSSIDIDNIAISNNQPTNMQMPIFDNIPLSNETQGEMILTNTLRLANRNQLAKPIFQPQWSNRTTRWS
jgi:hypothetical protein